MLNTNPLPSSFWSYAYSCTTHIHNSLTNQRPVPLTPMEILLNIRPNLAQMYPFCAEENVHVLQGKREKLDVRGINCRMLTFPSSGIGQIFYDPASKRVLQASSAVFPAYQVLPFPITSKKGKISYIINSLQLGEIPTSEINAAQTATVKHLPITSDTRITRTLQHAMNSPFASYWRKAALVELENFTKHSFWEPVTPVKGMKFLGEKWVFDLKKNLDETIE
ncbi:hypothetical protein O181_026042 [Austropuccinia psidii MF-1]|uniref:Uncharacterized protein n=1 Tax=Austropuccinia psidii MF-1 TaxID=1389203 RepID=A0A9Q3H0F5_9BASI|nr:hypothetical protein [Austropuccinia psidii MF-1]